MPARNAAVPHERGLRLYAMDDMMTEHLRAEAAGLGLPVIDVDTALSEDAPARTVAAVLGLWEPLAAWFGGALV